MTSYQGMLITLRILFTSFLVLSAWTWIGNSGAKFTELINDGDFDNIVCVGDYRSFKDNVRSLADCAFQCHVHVSCGSLYYTPVTCACVGCKDNFNHTVGQKTENGTKFYMATKGLF